MAVAEHMLAVYTQSWDATQLLDAYMHFMIRGSAGTIQASKVDIRQSYLKPSIKGKSVRIQPKLKP
jgi:acyl-coenzyme A thioesterase PaaI-like protein